MSFENLAFVLDAQGFFIEGKFVPRELAAKGSYFEKFYEFDIEKDYSSLNEKDKRTVNFCTTHVHGINFELRERSESSAIPIGLFEKVINYLYHKYKDDKKIYVGLRNSQLEVVLKQLEIPYIDLSSIEIIPWEIVSKEACSLHKSVCCNLSANRCALAKVRNLTHCIQQVN